MGHVCFRCPSKHVGAKVTKIEISPAFHDSCVAVQNPAHIPSGGRRKREKINLFDTIFSDCHVSPVIEKKAYPNRPMM
jgi:hypothetical protein